MISFPLKFHFPLFNIVPTIVVKDLDDAEVCYVRQQLFKLKEAVTIYRDSTKKAELGSIKADRVIDWSARYRFHDPEGNAFGAVGRRGAKSLWRAHYDIFSAADSSDVIMTIQEENPFTKVVDSMVGQIPVIGLLTGLFFHPRYLIATSDGKPLARLHKRRALLECRFEMEMLSEIPPEQSLRILLSCLMMMLLERARG